MNLVVFQKVTSGEWYNFNATKIYNHRIAKVKYVYIDVTIRGMLLTPSQHFATFSFNPSFWRPLQLLLYKYYWL